jgi:DNA-binding SARP family transcriptional activator
MHRLEVRLLGGFEVLVDSQPVPAEAWEQRRATDLRRRPKIPNLV